jgi:hypothetical protein
MVIIMINIRMSAELLGCSIPPAATNFVAFAPRKHKKGPSKTMPTANSHSEIARAPSWHENLPGL